MKRFLFLFILFTTVSQAQEVKTQNDIMQLPNTDLVKDFNLKTKGNIKPVTVAKSTYTDVGFGFVGKKFNYSKKDYSNNILTFENVKLTSSSSIFHYSFGKPNGLYFYYFYDENGVLKSMTSKSSNAGKLDGNDEKNEYSFYSNGFIKQTKFIGSTTTTQKYNYQNGTLSYNFANGKTTYHIKNGNITKQVTFNKSANKTYTKSYKYNNKGFLEFEDGGTYTSSYLFNKNNLIEKEVKKNYTQHFRYVYDKYGNWIIAYQLSTSDKDYSGNKTKTQLYGTEFSFYVREIKYSNGQVTGGKTPEHPNIKSSLLKVRSELYDELINRKKAYIAKKIRNLDLEFPLHEIEEDYGLKIGKGSIVPVQLLKKQYDQRAKRNSTEIATELKMESSVIFDKNLRKVKTSKVTSRGTTTTYNFRYDSQGKLKKYWSEGGRYGDTYENYTYQSNGNFTRTKSFKEGGAGIKSIYTKTADGYVTSGESNKKILAENNLVKKVIYGYDKAEPSETLISHNENGKVIKRETSFATVINQYNSNGDLKFFKETIKNSGNTTSRSYVYEYDKYGNWIIQVSLLDMSIAKGIPSFPQPTLREITYSNGEKTGTTDITKVSNELISLRKKVKNLNTNTGNQVATWKKTTNGNFYFNLDNKAVQKAKLSYMGKDILAFIHDNNQLYIMKGAQSAVTNNTFNAKKLIIETSHGYWFKKPNGGVTVFTNQGNVIKKSSLYKYAPNNIDVFYQGEGELHKVILKNYKNAKPHTVYPAINFDSYSNGNKTVTNTTAKRTGKCLKGDCDNGYGEFKHSNGYMSEGFFKNGAPYGPMHVSIEAKNESSMAFLKGNYKEYEGMLYRYYGNRYTEMVDYKKQIGVLNDAKERKTYKYNFKNGKAVSKTLLQEKANTGCIVGNCTNGSGVYKYNDGAFYFGTFQNGKYHGFGKLDYKNGNQYIGEFSYGKRHGFGTYIWSEYNYYMGEYQNGKYQGQGVMYYNKNQYDAGNWSNGKFIGKTQNISKTNYTNTSNTNNTNITKFNSKKNTTNFNSFSDVDKNIILACNNDAKCAAKYLDKLHDLNKEKVSSSELEKKMTGYFHSLYNMNPKMAYSTFFKIDSSTMRTIKIKTLPQAIQTDLKNRAQNLMNNYKKDMKKKGY